MNKDYKLWLILAFGAFVEALAFLIERFCAGLLYLHPWAGQRWYATKLLPYLNSMSKASRKGYETHVETLTRLATYYREPYVERMITSSMFMGETPEKEISVDQDSVVRALCDKVIQSESKIKFLEDIILMDKTPEIIVTLDTKSEDN